MLQRGSILTVADNSGPITVRILRIRTTPLKNIKPMYGRTTDTLRFIIRKVRKFKPRKMGKRLRGVLFTSMKRHGFIIRTKKPIHYKDGSLLFFKDNSCVIWHRHDRLRGRRVFGFVTRYIYARWLRNKFRMYF